MTTELLLLLSPCHGASPNTFSNQCSKKPRFTEKPLQCSCLENPRDGGAWWAAVYGVAQSQTRLKRLSSGSSIVDSGFPGGISGKELAYQRRRHKRCGFDPWVGKITGGEHGNPLKYSCLDNPMDRGAWQATVHRATKSQTRLKRLGVHTHSWLTMLW